MAQETATVCDYCGCRLEKGDIYYMRALIGRSSDGHKSSDDEIGIELCKKHKERAYWDIARMTRKDSFDASSVLTEEQATAAWLIIHKDKYKQKD